MLPLLLFALSFGEMTAPPPLSRYASWQGEGFILVPPQNLLRDTCCLPKPRHFMVRVAGMTFNFTAVHLDRLTHDARRCPVRSRRAKFVASAPTPLRHRL